MTIRSIVRTILSATLLSVASASYAVTLTIDTWGEEDTLWRKSLIPAFQKHHPDIDIKLNKIVNSKYFGTVSDGFKNGTAADLVICRPFDISLGWFKQGYLLEITEMEGMENFPSFAQTPWQTDSGAQTFCLPMGAVIHGFFYNKTIFKQLGLTEPKTESEFFALLDKVKSDGQYLPLAFSTKDKWESSEVGYQNIGPNYWHGEDGRQGLIEGTERIDTQPYQQAFAHLARWSDYMGDDYQQRGYTDSWDTFKQGKAAVSPAGSWEIVNVRDKVDLGVFAPPVPDGQDQCFFNDHTDKGIGINAASPNKEAAMKLLKWMTTKEFAQLFTDSEPGFFSLSNHFFEITDPTAMKMASWRNRCDSTIRSFVQILSRGTPNFGGEMMEISAEVLNGTMSPEQATQRLQEGLDAWYPPQQEATKQHNNQQQENQCDCSAPQVTVNHDLYGGLAPIDPSPTSN